MCLGFFKGIIGVFYKDFLLYWSALYVYECIVPLSQFFWA